MIALLLLATAPVQTDHPRTFLASVVGIPVPRDEMIESFRFSSGV
jgi:hypothetical protein